MIATIFDAIAQSNRRERGFAGEYFARQMFLKAGFTVERPTQRKSGDLIISTDLGSWKVEVKTAARRPDGKFTFQLIVANKTNCHHADYIFLVAVVGSGVIVTYLIPVEGLGNRKTITLPKNMNNSKWADFRVKGTVKL